MTADSASTKVFRLGNRLGDEDFCVDICFPYNENENRYCEL